jgi:hypothetical protein
MTRHPSDSDWLCYTLIAFGIVYFILIVALIAKKA